MAPPRPKPLTFSSIKVGVLPPAPTPAPDAAPKTKTAPEPAPAAEAVVALEAVAPEPIAAPPPAAQTPAVALASAPATAPQNLPLAAPLEPGQVLTRIAEPKKSGRTIYILAAIASVLWAGGLVAFVYGYETRSGPFALDPIAIGVLTLIALAPVGFIWAGAYAIIQARALAVEARRASRLTDELVGPTALAAAQAGAVVE
ncbi:MAG: hypothetical protein ACHP7N_19795, partial [Caulobacterales bacterium]